MSATLWALALIFTQLSLLAFGGGNTVIPEMQRQVVEVHQWMSARDFSTLFALAQAAPGPNLMVVPLVGWHVAGAPGLLVSSLAKFGPSSILTGLMLRLWERFKDRPWRAIVQTGLVPMTAGLVSASALVITQAATQGWTLIAIAVGCAITMTVTRAHPLMVLTAGALIGLSGVGQL